MPWYGDRLVTRFTMVVILKCVEILNYYVVYQEQINSEKEIIFVVKRGEGWGRGNWMKAVKIYKFSVIRQISTREVMKNR